MRTVQSYEQYTQYHNLCNRMYVSDRKSLYLSDRKPLYVSDQANVSF